MRSFVGEVSVAQSRERQIARWDRFVCTQLVGLRAEQAQFLVDQIARRAYAVGLTPGGRDCRPNVLLFVTRDAGVFTRELVARYRIVFNAGNVGNMSNPGESALEDFVATPRAVRWWHVAQTVSVDGEVIRNSNPRPNATGGISNVIVMQTTHGSSRLQRQTRQDFQRAIVIVDAARVQNLTLATLADYLAMTTLAQIDMSATVGDESILSLFSSPSHPIALTPWDTAYLDGLYHAPRNARDARQQESAISASMHHDLDR